MYAREKRQLKEELKALERPPLDEDGFVHAFELPSMEQVDAVLTPNAGEGGEDGEGGDDPPHVPAYLVHDDATEGGTPRVAEALADARAFLRRWGFVVFKGVVPSHQCAAARDEIWSAPTLVSRFGARRDDPDSWNHWAPKPLAEKGFVDQASDVWLQACWNNRQHEPLVRVFQYLLGRRELWVQPDRYGVMRPTTGPHGRKQWRTVNGWLHWDQSVFDVPSFHHLQGVLALSDNTRSTGSLVVVPGIAARLKRWVACNGRHANPSSFISVPRGDFMHDTSMSFAVTLREGSIAIWDGRTAHANKPNHGPDWRYVQYITYAPVPDPQLDPEAHVARQRLTSILTGSAPVDGMAKPDLTPLGRRIWGSEPWPGVQHVADNADDEGGEGGT